MCLGLVRRCEQQEGHTPAAVQWLAGLMAARGRPCLVVAPHLLDDELQVRRGRRRRKRRGRRREEGEGEEEGGDVARRFALAAVSL